MRDVFKYYTNYTRSTFCDVLQLYFEFQRVHISPQSIVLYLHYVHGDLWTSLLKIIEIVQIVFHYMTICIEQYVKDVSKLDNYF